MCDWFFFKDNKPKPGQRFIGAGKTKSGKDEWNVFTTPAHDIKDDQGKIEMTAEQQFNKIIEVYQLIKWMVPNV